MELPAKILPGDVPHRKPLHAGESAEGFEDGPLQSSLGKDEFLMDTAEESINLVIDNMPEESSSSGSKAKDSNIKKLASRRSTPEWVLCSKGSVPSNAVKGGTEKDGELLYVGRVYQNGGWNLGKVHPSHLCCYIGRGAKEYAQFEYQVLTDPSGNRFCWVPWNGKLYESIVYAGQSETDEPLYVGRATHMGRLLPGKVLGRCKICCVTYDGKQIAKLNFEVLVDVQ